MPCMTSRPYVPAQSRRLLYVPSPRDTWRFSFPGHLVTLLITSPLHPSVAHPCRWLNYPRLDAGLAFVCANQWISFHGKTADVSKEDADNDVKSLGWRLFGPEATWYLALLLVTDRLYSRRAPVVLDITQGLFLVMKFVQIFSTDLILVLSI
jgi:hypothetical protein